MTWEFEKGKELGKAAFHNGITSIPLYDKEIMLLLGKNTLKLTELLSGWANGWHEANLADPVVLENGEVLSMGH